MLKIKVGIGEKTFDTINWIFMIAVMAITLYPFLYVLFASFSDPLSIYERKGILLYPVDPTLEGYRLVFNNPNILLGFKNSVIYVLLGTAVSLLLTATGAYVLSRKGLMLGRAVMFMIVVTMFFGGGLIPFFLIVKGLGLVNTIWAIVLPGAVSTWNLIVMRTFFQSIPDSLIESAKIDGANDVLIFVRIVLPLSLAILAVMALFYGVGQWNSWFNAVIFLRHREMYPLQLFLREILLINISFKPEDINITTQLDGVMLKKLIKYSVIIVTITPIMLVYPFLQKYFVKGVMIGSLKE